MESLALRTWPVEHSPSPTVVSSALSSVPLCEHPFTLLSFAARLTTSINLPQTAVLGMHSIKEKPVVVNGQIVIRPIMVVALTYDHRLLDGRDSVTLLGEWNMVCQSRASNSHSSPNQRVPRGPPTNAPSFACVNGRGEAADGL
jgi:hypothetical protein